MNFLAQITPPPAAVASWLEVLFYVTGGLAACVFLWHLVNGRDGERTLKPQPFVVEAKASFATKAELEEVKREVASLATKIEHGFAALDEKRTTSLHQLHCDLEQRSHSLRTEIKDDTNALHLRITDVLRAVSELRGRIHADHHHP